MAPQEIPVYLPSAPEPIRAYLYVYGGAVIPSRRPRPNAWRRFWTWVLLGWEWESAE